MFKRLPNVGRITVMRAGKMPPESPGNLLKAGSGHRMRAAMMDLCCKLRIGNILLIDVGVEVLVLRVLQRQTKLRYCKQKPPESISGHAR